MKNSSIKKSEKEKIKMIYKIFFLILFLIASNNIVYAQSISELIDEATRNNQKLNSLRLKINSIEKKIEVAEAYPHPQLSLEFSQVPFGSFDLINNSISNSLSLSQMFPLGGKTKAMGNVERKFSEVIASDYNSYKSFLASEIRMTYFGIWENMARIEIQKKGLELLKKLESSELIKSKTSASSTDALLNIQSELLKAELDTINSYSEIKILHIRMNSLLGRNLESDYVNVSDIEISPSKEIDVQYLFEAIKSSPAIVKMEKMIEMNQSEITANEREFIPDLMLSGMIMRMPKGMLVTMSTQMNELGNDMESPNMYSIMASINLPFAPWSSKRISSRSEELFIGIKSIEEEKLFMLREMEAKVKGLVIQLKNSKEKISLYESKILPLNKKVFESQLTRFTTENVDISSIIASLQMVLMNEMELVMAKANYEMLRAEIEMMVGKSIGVS